MNAQAWLDDVQAQFHQYQQMCERAAAQVSDEDFFASLGPGENSIAVVMKHLAGNHRSRWQDFLTSDGEKRDRDRDGEFTAEGESRASIEARWEEGWGIAFASLSALEPDDLERTITIRGEPLTVVRAILRNLAHAAYHTGQIVQLARHFAGDAWRPLSIAPGKSEEFNAVMRERHGDWWAGERPAERRP